MLITSVSIKPVITTANIRKLRTFYRYTASVQKYGIPIPTLYISASKEGRECCGAREKDLSADRLLAKHKTTVTV